MQVNKIGVKAAGVSLTSTILFLIVLNRVQEYGQPVQLDCSQLFQQEEAQTALEDSNQERVLH